MTWLCAGIPYAYTKAGYVLSPIIMILITLLALLAAWWMPEVLARAEGLTTALEQEKSAPGYKPSSRTQGAHAGEDTALDHNSLVRGSNAGGKKTLYEQLAQRDGATQAALQRNVISDTRKFEVSELCGMFLGPRGRKLFELCVVLYFVGALWSYASGR
mgnify:CR=1 FL=1